MEFKDISNEEARVYLIPTAFGLVNMQIKNPLKLHVSASGGHRIVAVDPGDPDRLIAYYIPAGWIALNWIVKDDEKIIEF